MVKIFLFIIYKFCIPGAYTVEPLHDMSWSIFGYAVNLAYHFWILQIAGMVSL